MSLTWASEGDSKGALAPPGRPKIVEFLFYFCPPLERGLRTPMVISYILTKFELDGF
jgi:hypothetical protein